MTKPMEGAPITLTEESRDAVEVLYSSDPWTKMSDKLETKAMRTTHIFLLCYDRVPPYHVLAILYAPSAI